MSESSPEFHNPYDAPPLSAGAMTSAEAFDFSRTVEMLRQTRPWVRFLSVLLFIGAVVLGFAGVAIGLFGPAELRGLPLAFLAVLYVLMGFLYIVPGVHLWRYATHIGNFMRNSTIGNLNSALEAQKSSWKFVGIAAAMLIFLYVMLVLGTVLIDVARIA